MMTGTVKVLIIQYPFCDKMSEALSVTYGPRIGGGKKKLTLSSSTVMSSVIALSTTTLKAGVVGFAPADVVQSVNYIRCFRIYETAVMIFVIVMIMGTVTFSREGGN